MQMLRIVPIAAVFGLWTGFTQAQLAIPSCETSPGEAPLTGEHVVDSSHVALQSPGFDSPDGESYGVGLERLSLATSTPSLTALTHPFVHHRQTVPVSERDAEIWVSLPQKLQSAVSVNFVEYPPAGSFRKFQTRLRTSQPRRFYLSAKSWDPAYNHWVDLRSASLETDIDGSTFVDLTPGQVSKVQFVHPSDALACPLGSPIQIPVVDGNMLIPGPSLPSAGCASSVPCAPTSDAGASHAHDSPTRFEFDVDSVRISGSLIEDKNRYIGSVQWTAHPTSIKVEAMDTTGLPARPIRGNLNLCLQAPGAVAIQIDPIAIMLRDVDGKVMADIPFQKTIEGKLLQALVGQSKPTGSIWIKATLQLPGNSPPERLNNDIQLVFQ